MAPTHVDQFRSEGFQVTNSYLKCRWNKFSKSQEPPQKKPYNKCPK